MAERQANSVNINRAKAVKKSQKKRRRSGSASQIMAVLIVFLAFYLALSLLIAGFVIYSFNSSSNTADLYDLNVIYDEQLLYELDADDANNEYGLYIPFSYIAEISSFGLAGDGDDISLFIIGTDNRIKCTKNSSLIVINNNPIRISSPVLYDDESGEYLLPVSLIENYINGIDVTYDTEEMICNVSSDLSKNDVTLKLLLPEDMEAAYFPDSYKYYTASEPEESE